MLLYVASIIFIQGVPWTILYVFLKQGSVFLQDNYSLPYQILQLISSYLSSCSPYIALLCNIWFISMLLLFRVMPFFQLVYQTVFILDEWSGLVKFLHQLHSKFNVTLHLFSWFYQFSYGMAFFIWVNLATIFYASCPIFCWYSISLLFFLSTILFFLLRKSLRCPIVFCAAYLIIFISRWIEAYFCIREINIGYCLTLHNTFCISLFIAVHVTRVILYRFSSRRFILVCDGHKYLLKLLNKYLFVYSFIIILFFHIWFRFFYISKGLLFFCQRAIFVLTILGCLFLEIPTYSSILATSSKA